MAEIDGVKLSNKQIREHLQEHLSDPVFKYQLGQLVYSMRDSKVHSAPISSRMIIDNLHDEWVSNETQKKSWQPYGRTGIWYATVHDQYEEGELFATKEELLESL